MTEKQDKIVQKELGTSNWSFVGFASDDDGNEDGNCKVYQTSRNDFFAIRKNSDKVFFDVYEDNGVFTVY